MKQALISLNSAADDFAVKGRPPPTTRNLTSIKKERINTNKKNLLICAGDFSLKNNPV
jgi:hypothetical protein